MKFFEQRNPESQLSRFAREAAQLGDLDEARTARDFSDKLDSIGLRKAHNIENTEPSRGPGMR